MMAVRAGASLGICRLRGTGQADCGFPSTEIAD
jgi:hypothetical protein